MLQKTVNKEAHFKLFNYGLYTIETSYEHFLT